MRLGAKQRWHGQKQSKKNDFKLFEPYLDKIIELSRKAADYLGYDEYPYDALLDLYEEGLRASEVAEIWNDEMERLLGIRPKTYSEGVLQDIH